MVILFIAICIVCPALAILDMCVMKGQIEADIIMLILSAFYAFLIFVYPELKSKQDAESESGPTLSPYQNSQQIVEKTRKKYEEMMDISELVQQKPTNLGQPRQITANDRGGDSLICSEEYFMCKMQAWIPRLKNDFAWFRLHKTIQSIGELGSN